MAFTLARRARGKRGWLRRGPDAKDLAERLSRFAKRVLKDSVSRSGKRGERYVIELEVHPAAPAVELSSETDGDLLLRADCGGVGPALFAEAIAIVEPLLPELDVTWAEPFELAAAQRAACEWLAGELRGGSRMIEVEREFFVAAPVLTALGPRDAAWRDAVLADPMRARDAFAWWELGPGREELARALLAMWHDVPWREPIDDEERATMKQVNRDLKAAKKADASLALPWSEWAELHAYLELDTALTAELRERDAAAPAPATRIGYRRYDLDVELTGGWLVRMPGVFVGSWEDDGERYWATDGERSIDFTSVTANGDVDSAHLLAVAPEHHPVIDRLAEGTRLGRAEANEDDGIYVTHGLVAFAPHVAILTCKSRTPDRAWALAAWRSLRQAED